jgi:hypothetical protein
VAAALSPAHTQREERDTDHRFSLREAAIIYINDRERESDNVLCLPHHRALSIKIHYCYVLWRVENEPTFRNINKLPPPPLRRQWLIYRLRVL